MTSRPIRVGCVTAISVSSLRTYLRLPSKTPVQETSNFSLLSFEVCVSEKTRKRDGMGLPSSHRPSISFLDGKVTLFCSPTLAALHSASPTRFLFPPAIPSNVWNVSEEENDRSGDSNPARWKFSTFLSCFSTCSSSEWFHAENVGSQQSHTPRRVHPRPKENWQT